MEIWRSFLDSRGAFGLIFEVLGLIFEALRLMFEALGSFRGLGAHLGGQKLEKPKVDNDFGTILAPFWAHFGDF